MTKVTRAVFVLALAAALWLLPGERAHAYSITQSPTCKGGENVRWRGQPTTWYLNNKGYSELSFDETLAILQDAAAAWSEPCCSGFRSRYGGPTSARIAFPPYQDVIAFEEESWPPEAGSKSGILAITYRAGEVPCSITKAFMLFNAIDFRFVSRDYEELGVDKAVDLFTVAIHEFGHWTGLLHSDEDVVMRPLLKISTRETGLYEDDIAGVCANYPGSCDPCETSSDCPAGSVCLDDACVASECRNLLDCNPGTICVEEICVPGCRSHSECPLDRRCDQGTCVDPGVDCRNHVDCAEGERCYLGACGPAPTSCPICQPCYGDGECGPQYLCAPAAPIGICSRACGDDFDCPGNSICRKPNAGSATGYCLGPAAGPNSVLCPAFFACSLEELGPSAGCALLGDPCTNGSQGCGGLADTCIETSDGPQCSCSCRSDDECGEDARCLVDPSNELPSCYPREMTEACGTSFCPPGLTCVEETCVVDRCFGVVCSEGTSCVEGECVELPPEPRKPTPKSGCDASGLGPGELAAWLVASLLAAAWIHRPQRRTAGGADPSCKTRGTLGSRR